MIFYSGETPGFAFKTPDWGYPYRGKGQFPMDNEVGADYVIRIYLLFR
jgi:hypothetical protein